ncbi:MAG: hypothetical protein BWX94_01365 [Tenericutes bacterium ADurb.Bin140]|nr:MAG: hypothetical protein BWX94_01365 [Tenericutes bacterium ADurb.Bin140]
MYKETYLKDIINRNRIKNDLELEELLNILSSNIGSLTNPRKLADTFRSVKNAKISEPTIRTYLDYLQEAFLIEKVKRFDIKGKRYIDTPSKFYFTDLGIRNVMLNFRQLENAIYNELKIRGFSVDVGIVEVNNPDKSKTYYEIDFICNKADKRIYLQSAYSLPDNEKMNQEIRPFKGVNDFF